MIPATLNITAVVPVGEYALRLSFDDGTVQTVDFQKPQGQLRNCFAIDEKA